MFVDVETVDYDGENVVLTVNLDNVFFETCWPDHVKMYIIGHKEYYEKQSGSQHSSFEKKRYDYPLSWPKYNRLRGLMGLPIAHTRDCELISGGTKTCECSGDGSSIVRTDLLENIKDKAFKYLKEHPPAFTLFKYCNSCGHLVDNQKEEQ